MSCLAGEGNKRWAPSFREFLQPVITEMDPEECVEEQYKVLCCPVSCLVLTMLGGHLSTLERPARVDSVCALGSCGLRVSLAALDASPAV